MPNYSNQDGYMVLGASANSDPYIITHAAKVGVQLVVDNTNTSAGTVKVQISNNGDNWYDAFFWNAAGTKQDGYTTAAGPFNVMWNLDENAPAKYVRVNWTRVSGTGGLNYHVCAKKA